jgi:hypothetical protein
VKGAARRQRPRRSSAEIETAVVKSVPSVSVSVTGWSASPWSGVGYGDRQSGGNVNGIYSPSILRKGRAGQA